MYILYRRGYSTDNDFVATSSSTTCTQAVAEILLLKSSMHLKFVNKMSPGHLNLNLQDPVLVFNDKGTKKAEA